MGVTRAEQEMVIRWDEAEQEVTNLVGVAEDVAANGAAGGGAVSGDDDRWGVEWAVLPGAGGAVSVGTMRKAAAGVGLHLRRAAVRLAAGQTSEAAEGPRAE